MAFAREMYECTWIFDLFACGFDHLNAHMEVPSDEELEALMDAETAVIRRLHDRIEEADGEVPESLRRYLDIPDIPDLPDDHASLTSPDFLSRLAIALRVIDRACASLNYLNRLAYRPTERWTRVTKMMARHRMQLNTGSRLVVVKPRRRFPSDDKGAWWSRALDGGELEEIRTRGAHWNRLFTNLCRVPEVTGCKLIHKQLRQIEDLGDADWSTLRIGIVPLIQDMEVQAKEARLKPGPLTLKADPQNQMMITLNDATCTLLCEHAVHAVRYLAEQKVQIVLFPEAVVPDIVVQAIKDELIALHRAGHRYPTLVLAGTFEREAQPPAGPGYNQGIVLNGRGQVLWRQSKMHPYEMQPHEQEFYGLTEVFEGRTARERIRTRPRQVVFCDSRSTGTRMFMAICEDSAQHEPALNAIRGMQPNLVLIPVMAGPLEESRGFATTVADLIRDPACMAIVANSAALPRAEWRGKARPGHPPLGIVGLPRLQDKARHAPCFILDQPPIKLGDGPELLIFSCPGTASAD